LSQKQKTHVAIWHVGFKIRYRVRAYVMKRTLPAPAVRQQQQQQQAPQPFWQECFM
jgi:hypothetical protein